ncbi:hypothetical protein [Moritella sp. F3]|uniref:hypothetical protein n=1 Tax=Moritella sp. F3 TaxID=2718882 RepID=UPI0018E1BEA9|nr:hypothetical protein [Moritella sp. F3]GIC77146.1 hypothetical protein FMO001_18730 [Moritella sp. F1]GIC82265.1 hypothetical protein FMO003_25460 [Moritella sp. F3]
MAVNMKLEHALNQAIDRMDSSTPKIEFDSNAVKQHIDSLIKDMSADPALSGIVAQMAFSVPISAENYVLSINFANTEQDAQAAVYALSNNNDASTAAIQFALETDCGLDFLRCWNEGNFDACREEWPEAPMGVFEGADPLHGK